jgi:hypothetical protein
VLRLNDDLALLGRVVALRAPGKEVTANLDVVVRELAVLVVVHAQKFSLLGSAKLQAGNEVDDLGDDGGNTESPGAGSENHGNLVTHDDVVAIEEATGKASVDTVEGNNGLRSEESVEDEADDTADTVLSEDIERIVDLDKELD